MLVAVSPEIHDKEAISLAQQIAESPKLLKIPIKTGINCYPKNCFLNVESIVKQRGGQIVYGWAIWKNALFIFSSKPNFILFG